MPVDEINMYGKGIGPEFVWKVCLEKKGVNGLQNMMVLSFGYTILLGGVWGCYLM